MAIEKALAEYNRLGNQWFLKKEPRGQYGRVYAFDHHFWPIFSVELKLNVNKTKDIEINALSKTLNLIQINASRTLSLKDLDSTFSFFRQKHAEMLALDAFWNRELSLDNVHKIPIERKDEGSEDESPVKKKSRPVSPVVQPAPSEEEPAFEEVLPPKEDSDNEPEPIFENVSSSSEEDDGPEPIFENASSSSEDEPVPHVPIVDPPSEYEVRKPPVKEFISLLTSSSSSSSDEEMEDIPNPVMIPTRADSRTENRHSEYLRVLLLRHVGEWTLDLLDEIGEDKEDEFQFIFAETLQKYFGNEATLSTIVVSLLHIILNLQNRDEGLLMILCMFLDAYCSNASYMQHQMTEAEVQNEVFDLVAKIQSIHLGETHERKEMERFWDKFSRHVRHRINFVYYRYPEKSQIDKGLFSEDDMTKTSIPGYPTVNSLIVSAVSAF